jgi:hypothetical protein
MKNIYIGILSVLGLAACGAPSSTSSLQEAWNASNNPNLVSGPDYVSDFSKLPLNGDADHKGWSDDYWATYLGGISYRWQSRQVSYNLEDFSEVSDTNFTKLSPAEKYDLVMNRMDFPTVQSERERTRILKTVRNAPEFEEGYEIPGWEGLCHGWAPAALNFKEPSKPVTRKLPNGNSVTFYSADIKALLTYYQQEKGNRSTRTSFISERCNENFSDLDKQLAAGEITKEEWTAERESSKCKDMNAASLHLILANEIGLKKIGFVVDVTRDFEVWNQPVNSFRSTVVSESDKAGEGAAPGTVREVTVRTRMNYSVEVKPSAYPVGVVEQHKDYEYVLELDAAGKIIGGRWITEDRPDFAWRESTPVFQGYFRVLKNIYEQSL